MPTRGVIVAAGYGSRMLPVTRCVPKEMLPLLDRPAIDLVVEELRHAGVRDLLIITSRRKKALEDWFDRDPELEAAFAGDADKLARIRPPDVNVQFVRQSEMRGTGHALLLAREFAGSDPVIVAYPDDLFGAPNVSAALIDVHTATGCSVLAAQAMPEEELSRYGVLALEKGREPLGSDARWSRVTDVVEKPPSGTAPSRLVSFGRYLFTSEFFDALAALWPAHRDGEFFQTDALQVIARKGRLVATEIAARRYDTGTTAAWLETLVTLALAHPEYGPAVRAAVARANEP